MTNLKEQFYQTKNIEFLKKTLGRELWVQVSGSKDINGASAAFWAALMPVENIDEAYRDYSWKAFRFFMYIQCISGNIKIAKMFSNADIAI